MAFNYKIPPKFQDLAKKQIGYRFNLQRDFVKESAKTWKTCSDVVTKLNPERVLDLGCGLGRISIFFDRMLNHQPEFVLADSSEVTFPRRTGWNPGHCFYNDLNLTVEFCMLNGLKKFRVFDVSKDDWAALGPFSLVMSWYAIGFHYPIENSIERILPLLHSGSICIFSVRKGRYSADSFSEYFGRRELRMGAQPKKERVLILGEPKWSSSNT